MQKKKNLELCRELLQSNNKKKDKLMKSWAAGLGTAAHYLTRSDPAQPSDGAWWVEEVWGGCSPFPHHSALAL